MSSDSCCVAAIPLCGVAYSQYAVLSGLTPGGLGTIGVRLVVERNIGVPHNLATCIEISSNRAISVHTLRDGLWGAVATDDDDARLSVGDAIIHPRLQFVSVEDCVAFGSKAVSHGYALTTPINGVLRVPVGSAIQVSGL